MHVALLECVECGVRGILQPIVLPVADLEDGLHQDGLSLLLGERVWALAGDLVDPLVAELAADGNLERGFAGYVFIEQPGTRDSDGFHCLSPGCCGCRGIASRSD